MYRAVLFVLFLMLVGAERRSVQQSVFVSRKSRSNSAPSETGYVYSQYNNHPGTLAMFGNDASEYNSYSLGQYSDYPLSGPSRYMHKKSAPITYPSHSELLVKEEIRPYTSSPPLPSYEYLKAKAETKYESNFLPSKIKSDAMYEKLKSLMHYKYPDESSMNEVNYDSLSDYHIDDDDVRTSSRTSYDSWPYFYHSPYEYEAMKIDYDKQKAKDKRYIMENNKEVIPVHEDVEDIPHYFNQPTSSRYDRQVTTDNPVYGDQPFFSFVLNDYFDKSNEDDSLVFKGLDWGKEFDHEPNLPDVDDYLKRNRRLGNNNYSNSHVNNNNGNTNIKSKKEYDSSKIAAADSTTEKGYNKKHEFDMHEKGNEHKENHKSAYENSGNNYRGFKDFVDTFANRFGGEDHKKDAKYVLKKNQDKGENRKGFRRVYHKDEYQEEDEFYDNSNSTAKAEEKGGSSVHHGGSAAVLQSHAAAAIGNEASGYNNAGNTAKNNFENRHRGNKINKGFDSEFNRYRDVAKKAAESNTADYVDNSNYNL